MSAKSANCGSCVLLADLGNASTSRPVADDLRQGLWGREWLILAM